MKLIDKAAVIAEIERLQSCTMDKNMNFYSEAAEGEYHALSNFESFLNTLEVKEVDLEKEDAFIEEAIGWIDYNNRNGGCLFDGWEKDFRKYMKRK